MLKEKKRLIKAPKQKAIMAQSKHKTIIISTLNNFEKENLSILILKTKMLIMVLKK